jgi:hypothetical protein
MFVCSIRRLAAIMANGAGRRVPYILCPLVGAGRAF